MKHEILKSTPNISLKTEHRKTEAIVMFLMGLCWGGETKY